MNHKLNICECYLFQEYFLINSLIQYICNSNNNKKLIEFTYNNNDKMNNVYISKKDCYMNILFYINYVKNNYSIKSFFICYEKVFKSLNTQKEFKIFLKLIKYM